jgi:hypothetical protein
MSILWILYMNMKRYNLGIIYWEPYGNIRGNKKIRIEETEGFWSVQNLQRVRSLQTSFWWIFVLCCACHGTFIFHFKFVLQIFFFCCWTLLVTEYIQFALGGPEPILVLWEIWLSVFFNWQNFIKNRISKFKTQQLSGFGGIQSPKVMDNNNNNKQISSFVSQCVAKNIEGWLKFCISYMIYSQIWLNLPRMTVTFSTSSNGWSPLWVKTKLLRRSIARSREDGRSKSVGPNRPSPTVSDTRAA